MSVESQAVQILPGNIILILIFSSLPSLLILLFPGVRLNIYLWMR